MGRDDLGEWNIHFRKAAIPLEFHGELQENPVGSQPVGDLGEVKLRVISGDFSRTPAHGGEPRAVRPVFISDPKTLSHSARSFVDNEFVLAPRITPRVADQLRRQGTMFADERGNCFVSWPGVLIDVRGRMAKLTSARGRSREDSAQGQRKQRTASLFTPRRAQVSALLLSSPALLRASNREVAAAAGVSLGTANQTLDLLAEAGYLHHTRAGYRIDNADTLLDAWARAYPTGLGASREIFRGTGDLDRLADLKPLGWVSGERAVPALVHGGHTAHLYVEDEPASKDIIRAARLRRDDTGAVMIRSAFWRRDGPQRTETTQSQPFHRDDALLSGWPSAPLLVIYADLISVDDPRLSEIAQEVKSEIKEKISHVDR